MGAAFAKLEHSSRKNNSDNQASEAQTFWRGEKNLRKMIALAVVLCFLSSALLLAPAHNVKAALLGDLNGDAKVNVLDAQLLGLVFGMTNTDPNWNVTIFPAHPSFTPSMADLNGDGVINILDILILAKAFHA